MAKEGDFMRGGCFALAAWLHRRTGLELHGLFEGDVMHHAFVRDTDGTAFDARGRLTGDLALLFYKGRKSSGAPRATCLAEVEGMRDLSERLHGRIFVEAEIARFVRNQPDLKDLVAGVRDAPKP